MQNTLIPYMLVTRWFYLVHVYSMNLVIMNFNHPPEIILISSYNVLSEQIACFPHSLTVLFFPSVAFYLSVTSNNLNCSQQWSLREINVLNEGNHSGSRMACMEAFRTVGTIPNQNIIDVQYNVLVHLLSFHFNAYDVGVRQRRKIKPVHKDRKY